MQSKFISLVIACCLGVAVWADDISNSNSGVIFYNGFENTLTAGKANGEKEPFVANKSQAKFQDGKRGAAFLAGDGQPFPRWPSAKNLTLPEGSVEMWIKPLNWSQKNWGFHVFFCARNSESDEKTQNSLLLIYKYIHAQGDFLFYLMSSDGSSADANNPGVNSPDWYHFVAVYNAEEIKFYVNGKRTIPRKMMKPLDRLPPYFFIGDDNWAAAAKRGKTQEEKITAEGRGDALTLIDEVYIYNRALNDAEVKWACQNAGARDAGADIPALPEMAVSELDVTPAPEKNRFEFEAALNSRFLRPDMSAKLSVSGPRGFSFKTPVAFTAGAKSDKIFIPCEYFPKGDFIFSLSIRDKAGKVVGAAQKTVSSPGEAIWKGLGTGKSAAPPPPYSPVEELRDEFGFKCWNREVRFSQTGFPASIKSGDIELLKAQVELLTLIAGKAVLWKPERKRLLESDANHLVWLTESSSELGKLYVRITAEYDGMIRYDLKLDSGTNKTVDEMSLVLPLNRRQCSLWHIPKGWQEGVYTDLSAWSQGGMENPAGLSGKSRSAEYDLPWQYYVWTGNESAGLAAIMESEKAWSRTGRKDAVKMTARNNDILEIKWLFFKEKSEIPSQWEFTFGIQATPVKPLASRAWRHRGKYSMESASPNPNFHIYWTQPQLNPYFGYPASQRPSDYKAEVEKYKEKGVGLVPYVLLTQMATNAPEYEFHFKRLTPGGAKAATPSDTAVFGADAATVPVTASDDYIDFITWKTDNFVREYDLLGTYHDLSVAYPSDVSGLGYGFTRDGKRQKDISVFRTRELYKRMYTALKNIELETGKPRLMINHMAPVSWLAAYCDLFWWGEGHKDSYLRSLTANEMCFTYGGNLGARCLWLPQPTAADGVGDPSRKDLKGRSLVNYPVKSTQYLLTLLGLHDIIFTAIDCSPEAVSRYYKIMDSFGNIGEAVFLPYWKTREIIKGQTPEKLLCSAYIQKDNNEGCMLFIGNLTDGRIESSFVIDPSKLNAKRDASLINIETGVKLLRDEGGAYKLNVEPRDYLALKLK